MLDEMSIERVDKLVEKLRDRLQDIGRSGQWGALFELSKAPGSDYYRAPVMVGGKAIKKNWVQVNGSTYFHPSYSSPLRWKIQARFGSRPRSPLWKKKEPYIHNRQPLEWSIAGSDVYGISYESLAEALSKGNEDDIIIDEILQDLRISWAYANGLQDFAESGVAEGDTYLTLRIDKNLWDEFQNLYSQQYRSRKKHPKRPSYAELEYWAVHTALKDYITKYKSSNQSENISGNEGTMSA